MAGTSRGNQTMGDAVRSLIVLFGVVGAIVVLFNVLRTDDDPRPDPVEYESIQGLLREEYPYSPLAPSPAPDGWRATSVEHSQNGGNRWRLGFLTDDDGFVGLEQTDGEIEAYRVDRLADFVDDGQSTIDGVTWQRMTETDDHPDRVLVSEVSGVLTIVRGTESYAVLDDFAATLR